MKLFPLICLTSLYCLVGCLRDKPSNAASHAPVLAAPLAINELDRVRPAFWRGLGRPSDERLQFFEAESRRALTGRFIRESSHATDSAAEQAVYQARDYALQQMLGHEQLIWEWPRVRRILGRLGREVPLRPGIVESGGGLNPTMMFDPEGMSYWPVVSTLPIQELAGVLIHEATHGAFAEILAEDYGYSHREYGQFTGRCRNLQRRWKLGDESGAYVNEGVFHVLIDWRNDNSPNGHEALLRAGARGLVGTPADRRRFMDAMFVATERRVHGYEDRTARYGIEAPMPNCGHLTVIRGAHRGEYVFPTDVNPWLTPFFETIPWSVDR